VYLAENDPERMSPREILQQEDELIEAVLRNTSVDNNPRRIEDEGYIVKILESASEGELRQMQRLLQKSFPRYLYEFTLDSVRDLVNNPSTRTSVARNSEGEIVSICVAETAIIDTNRGNLYISELSEEATDPDHRRQGLNTACMRTLITHLYEEDMIDLIFEEARAPHIGVNRVAAKLGFKYAGRLHKHCVIGGTKEIPEYDSYENLNVWYLPRRFNEVIRKNIKK
jgi:GNAT superfamily N-acetyltransferase